MGRKKGPKHDHQSRSPNVKQSSEKLTAGDSTNEFAAEKPTTEGSTNESVANAILSESSEMKVAASDAETIDVLGNGLVIKKTLEEGLGRETRPSHGDSVVINYKCWLEDGTLVDNAENVKIVVGDNDIIHAFDLSIPLAEHKEVFELTTDSRFAYGSRGRDPDIPSGANLTYRIEILKVDDPPCYASMSNSERLAVANQKKDRGNYYYRREEFAFAIDSYNKALKILNLPPAPPTQSSGDKFPETNCPTELINDAKLKLENNLAAAQLKTYNILPRVSFEFISKYTPNVCIVEAYDAAIMSCDTVLKSDPQNIKALFRKGKALLEMNEVDDAIPILQKVLTISPGSQMASVELARARAIRQKEREHWSRSVNRRFPKIKQNKNTKLSVASRVKLVMSSRPVMLTSIMAILSVLIGFLAYIYQPAIMNINT